jgi:hypothetical protein
MHGVLSPFFPVCFTKHHSWDTLHFYSNILILTDHSGEKADNINVLCYAESKKLRTALGLAGHSKEAYYSVAFELELHF